MERKSILKNKYYLYLTEFFAGMAVMAVELGASRLLAPYFSSSQIVWTIIIGTIMIAMALGNIWGGRSADKDPNPDKLYRRILIAAVWIALIPVAGKYIILAVSALLIFTVSNNFLIIAAFAACMLIFVFPLFLLGTVTPSLAKYTVDSLDDNGKIVGTLGAFNTIGSIIGTFLPTFVTIPAVGTAVTFLIFSGVLLVLALLYFFSAGRKKKSCILAVVVFLLCSVLGNKSNFAFWEQDLLFEGESVYNYLQVKENEQSVVLSTNVLFGVQSVMQKEKGLTGMYYDTAMAAPLMADTGKKEKLEVLILGMGSGTYARQCSAYFDNLSMEGVEIDEKITDLSRTYFDLPEEVKVTTYDGRAYLQAIDKKYDVIMVDAYQDITIPFQMSSIEFFAQVKEHLNANGVMVVNMNMQAKEKGNINDYLTDTIHEVFLTVCTADVRGTTNRELFASDNADIKEILEQNLAGVEDKSLRNKMAQVAEELEFCEKGEYILTDDKAPVELLGIQVIDGLIENEVEYYKDIYKKEGIRGVLNQL